ncbi:MAG: hypothetical protein JOS17DRAFT_184339 [Linnemannia elongata]|nr:MAG: hypothetical protein JOS17DRAFT_184339 [Linnemannia elongata]
MLYSADLVPDHPASMSERQDSEINGQLTDCCVRETKQRSTVRPCFKFVLVSGFSLMIPGEILYLDRKKEERDQRYVMPAIRDTLYIQLSVPLIIVTTIILSI